MSLAIIVPYRDRADHLREMIPGLNNYLRRRHPDLAVRVYIVEQAAGKGFNVGMIRNAGFALSRDEGHDHVCFHDVDYVPVDVDYSPVARPTRLIWHGLRMRESYGTFFSAVVAFSAADFARINGYPNAYWNWGPEDQEVSLRCQVAGLPIALRDGTFRSLAHAHAGFDVSRAQDKRARAMWAMFNARKPDLVAGTLQPRDGLSSLRFAVLDRRRLGFQSMPGTPFAWYVKVEI